jgi:branched-chain amino acid transport system permease protein
LILAGGWSLPLLGLGIGYLTLRLAGVFFSIATLALSIVLQSIIINWEFVGGSRGLSVIRPAGPPFGNYVKFLFTVHGPVGRRLRHDGVAHRAFLDRSRAGRAP